MYLPGFRQILIKLLRATYVQYLFHMYLLYNLINRLKKHLIRDK